MQIINGLQNAKFLPVRNQAEIIFKYRKEIEVAEIRLSGKSFIFWQGEFYKFTELTFIILFTVENFFFIKFASTEKLS